MDDDMIFYADDVAYKEARFYIPAEKWDEFTASRAYDEMKAYAKELEKTEWTAYCSYERIARRDKMYSEAMMDIYRRLTEVRRTANWAMALTSLALALAVIALAAIANIP